MTKQQLLVSTNGISGETLSVRTPNRESRLERKETKLLKNKRLSSAEKRAEALGVLVERINRQTLYDMYYGYCGICGERVSLRKYTLDHIVPLSRGGEHSYANIQPSHRWCNSWKADKLPEEIEGLRPPKGRRRKQPYRNRAPVVARI